MPLTSFVGREHELTEIEWILTRSRLVTLTGAGGIGKTRLALEVAARTESNVRHGVSLVELAPLADPALVVQAVSDAIGVHERPPRSLIDTLVDVLRKLELLLVLDNCEHLVQSCAHFADMLLRVSSGLRLFVSLAYGIQAGPGCGRQRTEAALAHRSCGRHHKKSEVAETPRLWPSIHPAAAPARRNRSVNRSLRRSLIDC